MKFLIPVLFFLLAAPLAQAQDCVAAGQNPSTAFPVCGTSTFTQTSVALCGGKTIPAAGCGQVTDVNPYWYKFTCFQSGTLGFVIAPHTASDDYDWQLFDITGVNPDAVYTNPNLTVAFNWSGDGGNTGASNSGNALLVCDGIGQPLWSTMPSLVQGHEYILLVSHFTQTQSGYDLSFGGGTAVITDPTPPALASADASCGGNVIRVKLNKKMKCSSVAQDGSDFFITPAGANVVSALAIGCSPGYDTDSVELTLDNFLAPGTHTLNIKNGTDGNTILDYCNKPIPLTDKVDFTVYPLASTPMDSLSPVQCAPKELRLVFRKPVLCSSVAANGSDFTVTGSYPVSVVSAYASCTGTSTISREIVVVLSQPLYTAGNFTLTLKTGTDGNTIMDECGQETPAGSTLSFTVMDTVNADFSYQKFYGCTQDTVNYFHPGGNGINSWQWLLGDNMTSTQQSPQIFYTLFSDKFVELIVSNGFCRDTTTQWVRLDNFIKADFTGFTDICPNEPTVFTSTAQGNVRQHHWSFGDGSSSTDPDPSHHYAAPQTSTAYNVSYTVTDSIGCTSTMTKPVKVYSSCYLAVPNAFTPNNDGRNDLLYPLNAVKAEQLDFKVFNRWGQLVFQTKNWKVGWDGTIKGSPQAPGVYVWFLTYVDRDTKEARKMKGTAVLIR